MKVSLQNLTKEFVSRHKDDNKKKVVAVNDFTYEIPDGKLVALLGPSGCGKSTALYLICGLEQATSGKIYFDDEDVTDIPPEYRGVGLVFQNYALYPHLTAFQNIIFPLENLKGQEKMTKEQMKEKALEVAKLVQIEDLLNRKPSEMSGGQQQRVAIARALVKTPNILLLDEPLSNLDARLRLHTREEIRRIQKETKITTIFVTHDQEEAMSISDYIVVMKSGVFQQAGKPQEVYDSPANLFVAKFLGTPQINVFEGHVKSHGLFIGDDKICDTSLEDRDVYVGIRPEGFVVDENGPLHCKLERVEVRGRDISVLSTNPNLIPENDNVIRSIVESDTIIDENKQDVSFSLKPSKVLVYDKETESRLDY